MATPKVRLNLEMSLETENIVTEMAHEARTSKSNIIKKSIFVMNKVFDARKKGKEAVLISELTNI